VLKRENKNMGNKISYFRFGLTVLIFITLLFIPLSGCGDYKKFVLRDGLAGCSFEYSSRYASPTTERLDNLTSVFGSTRRKVSEWPIKSSFGVRVSIRSDFFTDYRALLEYNLQPSRKGTKEDEFNIVSRSPVVIDGAVGEQVIYNYINYLYTTSHFSPSGQESRTAFEAYIENGEFLWEISVNAQTTLKDQAKADYEHILTSFKFLD
jgi:hypothetical protein